MTSHGRVRRSAVWAMLDECAPGHARKERTHNWVIRWRDRAYPSFPVGGHGKRKDPEIEIGHVRSLIRHLEIDPECVTRHLPQLVKKR